MEQETGTVYMWVNLINGKRRVGHTCQTLNKRISEHKHQSKKSNKYFYKALRKYPIEESNWVIESLDVNKEEMLWLEKMWKILYRTTEKQFGYDSMIDEEDVSGENNPNFGNHKLLGLKRLEFSGENNPNFGRVGDKHPMWESRRPDLVEINKKRCGDKNPNAKSVILISPEGIEYRLSSYRSFCKEHKLSAGTICWVLKGKYNNHKGWTGRYL